MFFSVWIGLYRSQKAKLEKPEWAQRFWSQYIFVPRRIKMHTRLLSALPYAEGYPNLTVIYRGSHNDSIATSAGHSDYDRSRGGRCCRHPRLWFASHEPKSIPIKSAHRYNFGRSTPARGLLRQLVLENTRAFPWREREPSRYRCPFGHGGVLITHCMLS